MLVKKQRLSQKEITHYSSSSSSWALVQSKTTLVCWVGLFVYRNEKPIISFPKSPHHILDLLQHKAK